MSTDLRHASPELSVIDWRRDQLLRSGFPSALASHIALEPRFDLHALIELTERGCAPELAARIVSPLGDGSDR